MRTVYSSLEDVSEEQEQHNKPPPLNAALINITDESQSIGSTQVGFRLGSSLYRIRTSVLCSY